MKQFSTAFLFLIFSLLHSFLKKQGALIFIQSFYFNALKWIYIVNFASNLTFNPDYLQVIHIKKIREFKKEGTSNIVALCRK